MAMMYRAGANPMRLSLQDFLLEEASTMSKDDKSNLGNVLWSPEKRVVVGMLVWLLLLALGSAFVSTPFQSEPSAGANIDYAHVMYLHGLLIGMVGFLSLVAMDVFCAAHQNKTLHNLILWGTLGATLLSGIGGIFDHAVTDTFALWIQIVSFFFLDEILISLSIGLFFRAADTRRVWAWTGAFAAFSALLAAVMGHIAGWMLEFGDWPKGIIGGYATLAGMKWQDWMANLITSHSHEMVTAVIALAVATTCAAFGLERQGNKLMKFGLWLTVIGTILMTLVYVVGGFSVAQPPQLFASGPGGVNGLAGDDLVTGVFVMGGGLLALIGLGLEALPDALHRWGAALVTAILFITVVGFGYFIEFHENLYGVGAAGAPRAAADAVFTWFHQDFAFFMLPAILTVMLALKWLAVDEGLRRNASWTLLGGAFVSFIGGMLYIFVSQARGGVSFVVTTIGFVVIVIGALLAIWSVVGRGETRAASTAKVQHSH